MCARPADTKTEGSLASDDGRHTGRRASLAWGGALSVPPIESNALAGLSKHSKFARDPLSGHNIHVDNPTLVANAIEEVVTAAMKGTKLQAGPW